MTDEEKAGIKLAEEWVNAYGYGSDCNNISSVEANMEMVNAFLAGLKAGRPKWHKVSDGDLPKEQKEYWCKVFFYKSEETFNAFLWFDPNTKDFKFLEEIKENVESIFRVKAWCDILTSTGAEE